MNDNLPNSADTPTKRRQPGGVFISKGMTVGIPEGDLKIWIDDQGKPTGDCKLIVGLDITHHWLDIAYRHMQQAVEAAKELEPKWHGGEEGESVAILLEREFSHGMQAIGAAAFAIDAFYASAIDRIPIPSDLRNAWRRNRTSRTAQIMEVFRRGFRIGKNSQIRVRETLEKLFEFRDKAVHPSSNMSDPIWHPRLEVAMEWRYVVFREENARVATGFAINILAQLARRPKLDNKALVEYCAGAVSRIDPVLGVYEGSYGPLFDRAAVEKA